MRLLDPAIGGTAAAAAAAWTLLVLAFENTANQAAIREAGGIQPLVNLLAAAADPEALRAAVSGSNNGSEVGPARTASAAAADPAALRAASGSVSGSENESENGPDPATAAAAVGEYAKRSPREARSVAADSSSAAVGGYGGKGVFRSREDAVLAAKGASIALMNLALDDPANQDAIRESGAWM